MARSSRLGTWRFGRALLCFVVACGARSELGELRPVETRGGAGAVAGVAGTSPSGGRAGTNGAGARAGISGRAGSSAAGFAGVAGTGGNAGHAGSSGSSGVAGSSGIAGSSGNAGSGGCSASDPCGTGCATCPAPANASHARCESGTCNFDCDAGYVRCGDHCSILESTARDCGSCAHDCLGGACSAGVCQPIELLNGEPNVIGLAVRAGFLYFTTSDGDIIRLGTSGGAPVTLYKGTMGGSGEGIAVDASDIYWSTYYYQSILKMPIGGGTPSTFMTFGERPVALALDAEHLYYTTIAGGGVMVLPLNGGGMPFVLGTGSMNISWGVAVNATDLYWCNWDVVSMVSLQGGPTTTLASGQGEAFGVALDDTDVYWTTLLAGTVNRMPLGGGTTTNLVNNFSLYATGVAVDERAIYWVARDANGVSAIEKLAK